MKSFMAARIRGVSPRWSLALMSAPASRSSRVESMSPKGGGRRVEGRGQVRSGQVRGCVVMSFMSSSVSQASSVTATSRRGKLG